MKKMKMLPSSLLAMASVVSWFSGGGPGMAAAARTPPLLFQSPLVTAEQVRKGFDRCLLSDVWGG